MSVKEQVVDTDVLVIGTGTAGLRAAIEAKRYGADVLLVEKKEPGRARTVRTLEEASAPSSRWGY